MGAEQPDGSSAAAPSEAKDTPLAGVRVVELSHVLAAPTCGLMLADLGAEVVKVERPPRGDTQRWDTAEEDRLGRESASFVQVNRGKASVCLDLKTPEGRDRLHALLRQADVLLENYRPGVLDRLGFGYDALKPRYPALVYCSISGFGRSGPMAAQGGFDLMAQAMSGIMSITGVDGGERPGKCGPPVTDIAAGLLAAIGILAALHRQRRSGKGERIETSLFEAGIMMTYWQSAIAFASGQTPPALGTAHPLYAPYQAFPTADGWMTVGTANERNWQRLLDVLDLPELKRDERFADGALRMKHRLALDALLTRKFLTKDRDAWLAILVEAGIPAAPVLTVNQMHAHPQTRARRMVIEVPHAEAGTARAIGCPIKFAEAELPEPTGAPVLPPIQGWRSGSSAKGAKPQAGE